ncbi:nuclease-related domain-containing DEAD/DEAH box helicase [Photobacterium phosphoreum]|uniref:nuclease-related domain-containing DEAD/DEAH box helicase n=1 Tax=Photobacterium phosphoreum TaxID=659 RepID=UPI0024B8EE94|nr:NERD domain-containing protein [Photobacterium phosphoreum]
MAIFFPDMETILKLKVIPEIGELAILSELSKLDDSYEVFFNPYLDGDRPDILILKKSCGAFIIEVKDWHSKHYNVDSSNSWFVTDSKGTYKIKSPQSQVFNYKSNLYKLHLPLIAIGNALNKNFYNLVNCSVYMHNIDANDMNQLYSDAIVSIKDAINENHNQFKNKEILHNNYDKRHIYLNRKKQQIERDRQISFGNNEIHKLIAKINHIKPHILFSDNIYQDFKRRLSPPEYIFKQTKKLHYDKKQLRLVKSKVGFEKIKGVAGCGKTTVLAQRAVNALSRHKDTVLILTFNIALKQYVRDKISHVRGGGDWKDFEISNYHQFFFSQLNELGIDVDELKNKVRKQNISQEEIFDLICKNQDTFKDYPTTKYKTILIDEIQDYEPEWVKILRDNFLDSNGEMVLFGDQSQNIYERNENQRASVIVQGFGRWNLLTKSYRANIDSKLIHMFKSFQAEFMTSKDEIEPIFESEYKDRELNATDGLLRYVPCVESLDFEFILNQIQDYIQTYDLIPNDITILCSKIHTLQNINSALEKREKTKIMCETLDELEVLKTEYKTKESLDKAIENLRRCKKTFFTQNSGLIKLSTIHSFKGMESKTILYILTKDDSPEIVYTAMTRTEANLVVLGQNVSKYDDFFKIHIS